jgi:hypothetical protein
MVDMFVLMGCSRPEVSFIANQSWAVAPKKLDLADTGPSSSLPTTPLARKEQTMNITCGARDLGRSAFLRLAHPRAMRLGQAARGLAVEEGVPLPGRARPRDAGVDPRPLVSPLLARVAAALPALRLARSAVDLLAADQRQRGERSGARCDEGDDQEISADPQAAQEALRQGARAINSRHTRAITNRPVNRTPARTEIGDRTKSSESIGTSLTMIQTSPHLLTMARIPVA